MKILNPIVLTYEKISNSAAHFMPVHSNYKCAYLSLCVYIYIDIFYMYIYI